MCVPPVALLGQFPGLAVCLGECVDLQNDPTNCGHCGINCTGSGCIDGRCEPCPDGTFICPGYPGCHNHDTDPLHCGRCGNNCDQNVYGSICSGGSCVCPTGTSVCDGKCVATNTGDNCGSCGNRCGFGQSCVDGSCVCTDNDSNYCAPDCVDLETDSANCGGCDQICPDCLAITGLGNPGTCTDGACGPPSAHLGAYPGLAICSGGCNQPSPANSTCLSGGSCYCDATGDEVAIGGSCPSPCRDAGSDCWQHADCCTNQCVFDPNVQRNTCACPGGTVFSPARPCGQLSNRTYVGDVLCCGGTPETAVCATSGNVVPVCCKLNPSGVPLTEYFAGCNGACVDLFGDASSCGDCGVICPSGRCKVGGYCHCDADNTAFPAGTVCNTTLQSCR